LPGTTLLAGLADGYYKDSLGAVHILTLHATDFGLLTSGAGQKPSGEPLAFGYTVPATVSAGGKLAVALVSTRSGGLEVTLSRGGRKVASWHANLPAASKNLTLRLPKTAVPGAYRLQLTASAGSAHVSHIAATRLT
jgi:hypothetical protein